MSCRVAADLKQVRPPGLAEALYRAASKLGKQTRPSGEEFRFGDRSADLEIGTGGALAPPALISSVPLRRRGEIRAKNPHVLTKFRR